MSENMMTCADCDEMFLDYFEGTLRDDARAEFDAHVSSCARCQGLMRDVDAIRDEAANLPELSPSRDLWSGIEARIQPHVVSIASRPPRQLSKRWLAAAAAALIVATSGVTYLATMRSFETLPGATKAAVVREAPQVAVAKPETAAEESRTAQVVQSAVAGSTEKPTAVAARHESPEPSARATPRTSLASSSSARAFVPTASEIAFAGEISQLQTVLDTRRAQLDPETVKVVEDNLKVIDTAVKRARSALSKDPASGFLMRQLDDVLQKKVELLRTVALLPSST